MLVACWSSKGGSGTTVVSAALASVLGAGSSAGALLVDLAGDLPAALGLAEGSGPGVAGWLQAGDGVPADALGRLEVAAGPAVRVLPRGTALADEAPLPSERAAVLAALLAAERRPVVVDCGSRPDPSANAVVAVADLSLLVLRPCYLALRRAQARRLRATGVVLVREDQRAIGAQDVEAALGLPVVAVVPVTASIARSVDAGLLATRVPRPLERGLRHLRLVDGPSSGVGARPRR